MDSAPVLIILGGLPAAGKTTIARELARQIGATHIRIDTIEQALKASELIVGPMNDAGYRVAYRVAEDNLRLGNSVIADSVNPIKVTRETWRATAERIPVAFVEIEVVCSDPDEHRRRVETRVSDVDGLKLPTWQDVQSREYEPWSSASLVIDTAKVGAVEGASMIRDALSCR